MAKLSIPTVSRRRELTQGILDLLPGGHNIDIDHALHTWYYNIRESGGFRLTAVGYATIKAAAIESWSIPVQIKDIDKKGLLTMDRNLKWPYFIDLSRKRLVLFSSRDAVMATLYGDVKQWLLNLESR
jgi:hypothetical protein